MEHTILASVILIITLGLSAAFCWWVYNSCAEHGSPRRAFGRIVCENRGNHRLRLAECHWYEEGEEIPGAFGVVDGQPVSLRRWVKRSEWRPYCTVCGALIGD